MYVNDYCPYSGPPIEDLHYLSAKDTILDFFPIAVVHFYT